MAEPGWFTPDEQLSIRAAYVALSRVGNATRDPERYVREHGHWHPVLDNAHQDLGLVLGLIHNGGLDA